MDWQSTYVVPVLLVCGLAIVWHFKRSSSLLQQWANKNGHRLIDTRLRLLFRGPFTWTASEGQTVYRVTVEDKAGCLRSGWVLCGDWGFGMFVNRVHVRWDETTPRAESPTGEV